MIKLSPLAEKVKAAFIAASFQLFLVGGAVRDHLLDVEPNDFDFASEANPTQMMNLVVPQATMVPQGIEYGTVAWIKNGDKVEVTTFRRELDFTDNRRAVTVEFSSSIREDLSRRDFTIGAMALNVESGELIDPFGGREDLRRGLIRAVRDAKERFLEDALRVLRAVRFAARFGFDVDPEIEEAAQDPQVQVHLRTLSKERVRDELVKILKVSDPKRVADAFRRMERMGVLAIILPELQVLRGMSFNAKFHDVDPLDHTWLALENTPADVVVRLAVLLHDIGKAKTSRENNSTPGHAQVSAEMAVEILKRLKLHPYVNEVVHLVSSHMDDLSAGTPHRRMKRAGLLSFTPAHLDRVYAVQKADLKGRRGKRSEDLHRLDETFASLRQLVKESSALSIKDLQVNGQVIMAELAMKPGPAVGKVLKFLLESVMNGSVRNEKCELINAARAFMSGAGASKKNKYFLAAPPNIFIDR